MQTGSVRPQDDNGPAGFSSADFVHSADARSGTATVTVAGSDVDGADAAVSIRYADGARDEHEIHLANPSSAESWRFSDIGIYPADPADPPPVSSPPHRHWLSPGSSGAECSLGTSTPATPHGATGPPPSARNGRRSDPLAKPPRYSSMAATSRREPGGAICW